MPRNLFSVQAEVAMSQKCLAYVCLSAGLLTLILVPLSPAFAQQPGEPGAPALSSEEVATPIKGERMRLQTWTSWRGRLMGWLNDHNDATTQAFYAAHEFIKQQVAATGELTPQLTEDALAWYLLGSAYLHEAIEQRFQNPQKLEQAERALRRSLQLRPDFASAHANLGLVCMSKAEGKPARLEEASKEFAQARQLEPDLGYLAVYEGQLALMQHH